MQSSIRLGNWEILWYQNNPSFSVTLPGQIHGSSIVKAELCNEKETEADGIIGTLQDSLFGIHTADCLPLVIITDTRAAVIHISRHTLVVGILDTLTQVLHGEKIIGAYIGPHICEKCFTFEEKGEGILQFQKTFPYAISDKQYITHISLDRVVTTYLRKQGLDADAPVRDARCTFETLELPSYRRWLAEGKHGNFPRMITAVRGALQ